GGIYSIAHFIKLNVTMLNYMFILFGISFVITVLYIMQNKYFEKEMVIKQFKHDVTIIFGNKKIKGTGFVDTGNHLSDSKTAEPIIMIPSDFLTTGDVSMYLEEQKIESWYTEYSVINASNQQILVFKPTVILIGEKIINKGIIGIVNNKFADYDFLLQPSLVVGN
ncbi:MAG: sigma-E processing peptidase SpoIIGA, partial [Turicibacter sp.]